jgi:hypothetical protein
MGFCANYKVKRVAKRAKAVYELGLTGNCQPILVDFSHA